MVAASPEAAEQRAVDAMPGRVPISPRFLEHHSAVPVEVAQEARDGRELIQLQVGPLPEVPDGLVEHHDACAATLQLRGRPLEDIDLAAEIAQDQRGREPAERAPDHPDPWPATHDNSSKSPSPYGSRAPTARERDGRLGLPEDGDAIDAALEQPPPLIHGRVAEAVGRLGAGVLG